MRTKRKMNIANVWVIVIFTMIACTLAALFMLIYHSFLQEEQQLTLRNHSNVLADQADAQLINPLEYQVLQRLASKDASTEYVKIIATEDAPAYTPVRGVLSYLSEVCAVMEQADILELYFPRQQTILSTRGVRYLDSKKYITRDNPYAFLQHVDQTKATWQRLVLIENNESIPYILCITPYSGVYSSDSLPLLISYIKEENFYAFLRKGVRALEAEDQLLLTDQNGTIWSGEDSALVGSHLPLASSSLDSVTLQNGREVVYSETASSRQAWNYVLAHPSSGRFTGYDDIFSLWTATCLLLLIAGMGLVLWVIVKHYSRPMNRLINTIPIPAQETKEKRISSPSEHFTLIESALSDMNKMRQDQEIFLSQNQPLLREAWLNCFVHGEAHYLSPQPQLNIDFPHPHFQVAIASPAVTEEEKAHILSWFHAPDWTAAAFETREKESVFLFNHAFDASALPKRLKELAESFHQSESQLVFGVGILAHTEELVPASFRCARRALSAQYFEKDQWVSVFDPEAPHAEYEIAMSQVISQLSELTGLIRHQSEAEVNQAIDSIVMQLKESSPYPNAMRSIMLLAAMFLNKVVYDMKGAPEAVYGENLSDAYYHIEGISEFSQRLKEDSARLGRFLSQENSASNRSVVQYAIHHIRNAPPSNLSIQSIADALSISTGHLSRMFHQETGRKLVDYLQEVRMEHAARLLAEGNMTNEELCEYIGYSRLQYFSSKFKEHYGLTLNEYRRKVQYEKNT